MTPSPSLHDANRRGIVTLSLSMASFLVNDALVKYVSQSLAGAQLIFIRGVFSSLLMLGVLQALGVFRQHPQAWRDLLHIPVQRRSLLDASASLVYLSAVFHIPLADATAINMATPIMITVLAGLFLREVIPPARWLLIAMGFVGVLLIVQPGAAQFSVWYWVCVGGTVLHALRDLSTRAIAARIPTLLITLSTAVTVTLMAGVISLWQGWQDWSWAQLGILAAAAVFLSLGHYLLILSSRSGEMSVIAPFRYSGLLFAVVLGYALWGDLPNAMAWVGIALLMAAGVFMLRAVRASARADLDAGE